MNIIELNKFREMKRFHAQMEEIKEEPFIQIAGETIQNLAVYGVRKDNKSVVSVKYNPVFNSFAVEIEADSESDVMEIIEKVKRI